jgi:hypothetical protein
MPDLTSILPVYEVEDRGVAHPEFLLEDGDLRLPGRDGLVDRGFVVDAQGNVGFLGCVLRLSVHLDVPFPIAA